jgi:hypothetical protein
VCGCARTKFTSYDSRFAIREIRVSQRATHVTALRLSAELESSLSSASS